MFQKLADRYKVPNPLDGTPAPAASAPIPMGSPSPFGSASITTSSSKSAFGQSPGLGGTPSPFTSGGGPSTFPSSPSPFGQSTPVQASPFGQSGAPAPQPSPFGQSAPTAQPSPFGGTPAPGAPTSQARFNGLTAREMLTKFYQEKDPSRLPKVDTNLAKYVGKEDDMFRALAKKWKLDPSVFGVAAAPPTSAPGAFVGGPVTTGSPAGGFGQASVLGGGPSPFGGVGGGGGFGQPSALGSGGPLGVRPGGGGAFGAGATTGFGAASSFGSLAHSSTPSPFSGQSGGFGSSPAAFGAPATPFGAPRR